MEHWQSSHVRANLPELVKLINFNSYVKTAFKEKNILSNDDFKILDAKRTLSGKLGESNTYIELLVTRKFAYETLAAALLENGQIGAAKILITGLENHGIKKPLTHLGITLNNGTFQDAEIVNRGNSIKIKNLFSLSDLPNAQNIFEQSLSEMSYYEMIVQRQKKCVIIESAIPPKPLFYIQRNLSDKPILDASIFKKDSKDIFVFENLGEDEISKLVKPNVTALSSTQRENITSRFISLDFNDEWDRMVKIATVPIHLISYQEKPNSDEYYFAPNSTDNISAEANLSANKSFDEQSSDEQNSDEHSSDEQSSDKQDSDEKNSDEQDSDRDSPDINLYSDPPSDDSSSGDDISDKISCEEFSSEKNYGDIPNSEDEKSYSDMNSDEAASTLRSSSGIFVLMNTSGHSDLLKMFGADMSPVGITEEEFVNKKAFLNGIRGVCICDKPGTGKSWLLANIARNIAAKSDKNLVAFISLTSFFENFDNTMLDLDNEFDRSDATHSKIQDKAISSIFEYISSLECATLLHNLTQSGLVSIDLLLDGIDEIPLEKATWLETLLELVLAKFETVQIFITARLHMKNELKTNLGLTSTKILPFDDKSQLDVLVHFWSPKLKSFSNLLVQKCAGKLLKAANVSFLGEIQEITGIPLWCRLVAHAYAENALHFCLTEGKTFTFPILTTHELYSKFMEQRIGAVGMSQQQKNKIKSLHVQYALNAVFPHSDLPIYCKPLENEIEILLKVGIVQNWESKGGQMLNFVHRSLAEYLLAEHFSKLLPLKHDNPDAQLYFNLLVNHLLKVIGSEDRLYDSLDILLPSEFEQEGIAFFLNSFIGQLVVSADSTKRLASVFNELPRFTIYIMLAASGRAGYTHLFHFLGKAFVLCRNDDDDIQDFFTKKKLCVLFGTLIKNLNNVKIVNDFMELAHEIISQNLVDNCTVNDLENSCLEVAVRHGNYSAVEYFLNNGLPVGLELLKKCLSDFDDDGDEIEILKLLLSKAPSFIRDVPDVLAEREQLGWGGGPVHDIKILLAHGAAIPEPVDGENFVCFLLRTYDDPEKTHELVEFLLIDCEAEYLFKEGAGWHDPLPCIIKNVELLPKTFDLLLKIPGVDIHKEHNGENLLFYAIKSHYFSNFEELVKRGVDPFKLGRNNKSLLQIAKNQNNKVVEFLCTLGINPNTCDQEGNTVLHNICHTSTAKLLMKYNANLYIKNKNGESVLHRAVRQGSKNLVRFLVANGLNVNDRDNYENTVVHFCFDLEMLQCCVELGADVFAKNKQGQIALHGIVGTSKPEEKIRYLIASGLSVNEPDHDGKTPLFYCKKIKVLKFLIELGANFQVKNKFGCSLLHEFVGSKKTHGKKMFKYLVSKNLNINDGDNEGNRCFHFCGGIDELKLLVNKKANIQIKNKHNQSLLHSVAGGKSCEKPEIFRYLLRNGLDVNGSDDNGNTPIHFCEELEAMECLMKLGANIHVKNKFNQSAFHMVALGDSIEKPEIFRYLQKAGLQVNEFDTYGNTPFHICKELEAIKCLVELGASIFVYNNFNQITLHLVASGVSWEKPEIFRYLVGIGLKINHKDINGNTPLSICGEIEPIKCLVELGAEIQVKNDNEQNVLHLAAQTNSKDTLEILRYFVTLGVNFNDQDVFGNTPLHLCGHLESFKCLVNMGADVQIKKNNGQSILHYVATNGALDKTDIFRYLVSKGLMVTAKDIHGNTPLLLCNDLEAIKCLAELGANILDKNTNEQSILHLVAHSDSLEKTEIFRYLISIGLNVNENDVYGYTPLHYCRDVEEVKCLVELGANINAKNKDGQCLFFSFALNESASRLEMFKYLVSTGLNTNERDYHGCTPLFYVKDIESATYLVQSGADIHVKNSNNNSILHYAASRDKLEVFKYLVNLGLNINDLDDDGDTPLHCCYDIEAVDCLLELGACINLKNKMGQGVLHTVVAGNSQCKPALIRYLVDFGLNINDIDDNGNTPLHCCMDIETLDCLVDLGARLDHINNKGQSVLHTVAAGKSANKPALFGYLVNCGLDLDALDFDGNPPLHYCNNIEAEDCLVTLRTNENIL